MNGITVNQVDVMYNMSLNKVDNLKEYLISFLKGDLHYQRFFALKNISFSVERGKVIGIIGRNGAGKSTLLKVLAGVLYPSAGSINIEGIVAPLIELGAGFDGDLTGRENIYLNGAIMGYTKKYLTQKFDEIVEFSGLDKFIDIPVKNYSSGMYARLGFSIATIVQPDILLVDEILSVGDISFQCKCNKKIQSLISRGTTVIIVSHSMNQIVELCSEVIWLEKGIIRMQDKAEIVCQIFVRENEKNEGIITTDSNAGF